MAVAVIMMIRLDKYLAELGYGTRSQVKKDIAGGQVTVNGVQAKRPEIKIDADRDQVTYKGDAVTFEKYEKPVIQDELTKFLDYIEKPQVRKGLIIENEDTYYLKTVKKPYVNENITIENEDIKTVPAFVWFNNVNYDKNLLKKNVQKDFHHKKIVSTILDCVGFKSNYINLKDSICKDIYQSI